MSASQKISTPTSDIWIDNEGVLCLVVREGMRLNEEEAKRCFSAIKSLSGGKKVCQLMKVGSIAILDKKAQAYAAKHGPSIFKASAIVVGSSATALLYNFFMTFFKTEVPMRMFYSELKAREWLRKFN